MILKVVNAGAFSGVNIGDCLIGDALDRLVIKSMDRVDLTGRPTINRDKNQTFRHATGARKVLRSYIAKPLRAFAVQLLHHRLAVEYDQVLIGGGNILFDTGCNNLQLTHSIATAFGRKQKTLKIVSAGVGPFQSDPSRMLSEIAEHANFISVRDQHSQEILSHFGINSKLLIDPVWFLGTIFQQERTLGCIEDQTNFGVNLMQINVPEPSAPTTISKSIHYIQQKTGLSPKLFISAYNNDPIIVNAIRRTYAELYGAKIQVNKLPRLTDGEASFNEIRSCKFVVSHRMHVAITASAFGIPTVVFPWQQKIPGVYGSVFGACADMFMSHHVFDPCEILELVENQIKHKKELAEKLSSMLRKNRHVYNTL